MTVRGSTKAGIRPYVNFVGARYSSDVLSGNPGLIGKGLHINIDIKELRRVRAFFENGDELGLLVANRPWCFTAHSLRTRREILRLPASGKLRYREGDDAVEAFVKYQRKEALRRKGAVRDVAKIAAVRSPPGNAMRSIQKATMSTEHGVALPLLTPAPVSRQAGAPTRQIRSNRRSSH